MEVTKETVRMSFQQALNYIGKLFNASGETVRAAIAELYEGETQDWRPRTAYTLPIDSARTKTNIHKEKGRTVVAAKFNDRKTVEIAIVQDGEYRGAIVARRIKKAEIVVARPTLYPALIPKKRLQRLA